MNPLTEIGLIVGAVLNITWSNAVVLSDLIMKKGKTPTWLQRPRTLKAMTPVYYISFIGTLGLFAAVPLLAGSVTGTIFVVLALFIVCWITVSHQYSAVRTTAEGRALCVVVFSTLSIALIPMALLIAYYVQA